MIIFFWYRPRFGHTKRGKRTRETETWLFPQKSHHHRLLLGKKHKPRIASHSVHKTSIRFYIDSSSPLSFCWSKNRSSNRCRPQSVLREHEPFALYAGRLFAFIIFQYSSPFRVHIDIQLICVAECTIACVRLCLIACVRLCARVCAEFECGQYSDFK